MTRHWSISEAIRLLRQADAREPLEDLLRWVRAQGPTSALVEEARHILNRSDSLLSTRCDLAVLASAADLLSANELAMALNKVEAYRRQPGARLAQDGLVSWAKEDVAWRAVASIVPGSQRDTPVAESLRNSLTVDRNKNEAASFAFQSVIEALDWAKVSSSEKDHWRSWASDETEFSQLSLRMTVFDALDGVARHSVVGRPTGLDLAARLIWESSQGIEPLPNEVAEAVEACRTRLEDVRGSAAAGSYGFGGFSPADLAVAIATLLGRYELWDPILELLADPTVAADDKSPALDRLAATRPTLPDQHLSRLAQIDLTILGGQSMGLTNQPALPLSPAALRFAMAYRLIDHPGVVAAIAELTGFGRLDGKVEAARSIGLAGADETTSDWAVSVLLQLSHDGDPVVRAEAGRALGRLHERFPDLSLVVGKRLRELIEEDGILVPVLVLRGLLLSGSLPWELQSVVHDVSKSHPARSVRELARELLEQS